MSIGDWDEGTLERFVQDRVFGDPLLRQVPAAAYAAVTHSGAQSIPTGAVTALTFDTEREDPLGLHDAVHPTRLTANASGVWAVFANVEFAASTAGNIRNLRIAVNGAASRWSNEGPFQGTSVCRINCGGLVRLSSGDYVEATVFHDAGVALNANKTADASPELAMARIG